MKRNIFAVALVATMLMIMILTGCGSSAPTPARKTQQPTEQPREVTPPPAQPNSAQERAVALDNLRDRWARLSKPKFSEQVRGKDECGVLEMWHATQFILKDAKEKNIGSDELPLNEVKKMHDETLTKLVAEIRENKPFKCRSGESGTYSSRVNLIEEVIAVFDEQEPPEGVTPQVMRQLLVSAVKAEVVTEWRGNKNSDMTGWLEGLMERYNLTTAELGLTAADIKELKKLQHGSEG